MAKDKELADHERAHSGQPGAKVKHGASAVQTNYPRKDDSLMEKYRWIDQDGQRRPKELD